MKLIILFQFLLLGITICNVESCTLHGFIDMGFMERFVQSQYVVYGKTVGHVARKVTTTDKSYYAIDAKFEVHCIFKKGDDIVTEQISVLNLSPRDQCSGTPVTQLMRVGDHAFLALKSEGAGKFSLDEISPSLSAAVRAYTPYFFSFARLCHMQSWESPLGATSNKCPICGISDFDPEVGALNNTDGETEACLSLGSYIISENMASICDLYLPYTIEEANDRTCVPSDYNGSCALLVPRTTSATCDCSKKRYPNVNVGAGEMVIPNIVLIMVLLVLSW